MKNNGKDKYLWASFGISAAVLLLCLASIIISPVFSATSDVFNLTVTITNAAPTVYGVVFGDVGGGSIQLTASGSTTVTCNATISDTNGYADVTTAPGHVNATLWHTVNGTVAQASDVNSNYKNSTGNPCTFGSGNGNLVNVTCTFGLNFSAINGTWNCTINASDVTGGTGQNSTTTAVDQLNAMSVLNGTINFGSMAINANSSTGLGLNVTNEGNININVSVQGSNDLLCSVIGQIGVRNVSFNVTNSNYDVMSPVKLLSSGATNVDSFNLGLKGVLTADTINATKNVYWTIDIPEGVSGTCNNTVTLTSSLAL